MERLDDTTVHSLSTTPPEAAPAKSGGWLKWVIITPVVLFGLVMCVGSMSDPNGTRSAARAAADKDECARAMMSSIGHSTRGYSDQAAYEARVRDKCSDFSINGKPVAP